MSDYETTLDESKPKKRRSSIFQVVRSAEDSESISANGSPHFKHKKAKPAADQSTDFREYIESLRHEREKWIQTYREWSARRTALQKEKVTLEKVGMKYDLSILSESDRTFILDRPQYQEISKNIDFVARKAVEVGVLSSEVQNLNKRLTQKVEAKLAMITKTIIKESSAQT